MLCGLLCAHSLITVACVFAQDVNFLFFKVHHSINPEIKSINCIIQIFVSLLVVLTVSDGSMLKFPTVCVDAESKGVFVFGQCSL